MPQKIAFKALLLALAVASAALSQVDLAASNLVHPTSTTSHTASSIEHKNALIRTFQKHNYYHQKMVALEIETYPSQCRVKDRTRVFKPQQVHLL